uniref:transposase n=1 Tax=Pontibacter pamirensis TaxID=2562824 RepID=UPI00138A52E6|nr:transposase [Pontibacter pamirensis]
MESAQYIAYLLSEPRKVSCVKASEVLEVSHDEINRFLLSSHFTGKDLFEAVRQGLKLEGGVLSVDDSVLDKPFTDPATTELVGYFYSGRHHSTVKGINLITLFYTDASGVGMPVNFRVYRHEEGKTKHAYFQEMVKECWQWGLHPEWVSADSWYASIENLKFLRDKEVGFLVGLEANRIVSTTPCCYEQVGKVEHMPQEGLFTHLKGFDFVQVFRRSGHRRPCEAPRHVPARTGCVPANGKRALQRGESKALAGGGVSSRSAMPSTSLSGRHRLSRTICSVCCGPTRGSRG